MPVSGANSRESRAASAEIMQHHILRQMQVHACGICHGDVIAYYGLMGTTYPRVPGHEIAGVVEAVGEGVSKWKEGDR